MSNGIFKVLCFVKGHATARIKPCFNLIVSSKQCSITDNSLSIFVVVVIFVVVDNVIVFFLVVVVAMFNPLAACDRIFGCYK